MIASFLISLIELVITLVTVLFIANMLLSFAPLPPWHPVREWMRRLTDPILKPFRGLVPPMGMFDFTPLVAIIVIQIIGWLLVAVVRAVF
jgi:YggT family protein